MIEYNITVLWPCFIFGLLRIWWIKLILRQLELMKSIGSTRKISDHSFPLISSIYIDLKQLQQAIMKLTLNWNIELVRSWFHSKVYGSNVPQPFRVGGKVDGLLYILSDRPLWPRTVHFWGFWPSTFTQLDRPLSPRTVHFHLDPLVYHKINGFCFFSGYSHLTRGTEL